MEPYYVANTWPTSRTQYNFSTTVSDAQPMAVFQTVWPCFPYEVTVPRPTYTASNVNHAGVVVPLRVMPPFHNMLIEKPSPEESRKLILDRSLFDLVDAHPYLALTDPKLLGWYLQLSPQDRKIIQDEGGFHQFLQRHPSLELSSHHVYVKYNIGSIRPGQSSMSSNRHIMCGAKTCRCGMPHTHLASEMFPNKVRETLTPFGCSNSGNGSQKWPHEEISHPEQPVHSQEDSFQMAFNSPITQEPNHQMAHEVKQLSDSPLSKLNKEGSSWQMDNSISGAAVCKDQAALSSLSVDVELERCRQGGEPGLRSQSANFTYAEVSPLQSQWPAVERASPSVDTADHDEASSSFEDQSDNFYSIMEDDMSILACLPSENVKAHNSGVHSDPGTTNSEALADSSETLKSDQSVFKMNTAEKYTSPVPCVPTCHIMVGTEPVLCMSTFTQTEDPGTSDKHVLTEVHMADLDYLAEEFMKLTMTKEEPRAQKEKMKSLTKECDCIQRAKQAELCHLALQYSMCRQHCWRVHYISVGGQLSALPKNPPANTVNVLQKLESDYNQKRDKILAGVPLEQLKPLSVDCEKIPTGAIYIPAQIIGDVLGHPSWSSQEPHYTTDEDGGSPNNESSNDCQHSQRKQQVKKSSKVRRAVTFVPQDRDAIHNASKQGKKQTSPCKELNTSEAWYDAEEDLESTGPAVAAETGQDPAVITKDTTNESTSEAARSSVLCVSYLPSNVTESDVMLWFEKYHACEVSISAFKNDLRVAIVMMSGPQSAEAAVRELNGCSMQGHTLHVEHISRAIGGSSLASAPISGPESSQDPTKPQCSKTESSNTETKLITESPLSSSIKIRKVVCVSPTAKGTCVPQHYGTMGSFDTLMAELTQRHPDVGRQRIVDALIELKAEHQGVLSGLPLRTIREMTSDLLTRPMSATQL